MNRTHRYQITTTWTGNRGAGTESYSAYSREHLLQAAERPEIPGSSDPAFRGDPLRYNPEELLVAALSSCHMLWYLHLCAHAGVTVTAYRDDAVGTMEEVEDGSGRFVRVLLRPEVVVADAEDVEPARNLHASAHRRCFIANSVNFPVAHEPVVRLEE